jgi:uncharacterized protein (TIGR03000 family)
MDGLFISSHGFGRFTMGIKRGMLAAVVAVSALGLATQDASAFWGHGSCGSGGGWGHRGGWGSGGSWGGSGGSWGGGSGGSRGSWGGGWSSRGSNGGSWGGGGSSGSYGSSGGYGSSGSAGSFGSAGGYSYSSSYSDDGSYASNRSEVVYGRVVTTTQARPTHVVAQNATKTRLQLRVPADAKVTLAGVETKQSGEVRSFTTTKLASGQVWDGYKVVIEMDRNGQVQREERTIKLTGGESQELSIDFDSTQVAQR